MDPVTIAQATYEKAVEAQRIARKNLDDQNASLADWKAKFDEAKKVLDASKPAVAILKAQLQKADADVAIARAELAKLAPEKAVSSSKGSSQDLVSKAVVAMLAAAGPEGMTTDDIFARLQADGVEMAGAKPRENLGVYIARWSKVPASGIVSVGRGKWAAPQTEGAPPVPPFLAPAGTVNVAPPVDASNVPVAVELPKAEVPAFLTTAEPVPQDSDDAEDEPVVALPLDLPSREALMEAGLNTVELVKGKTHDQLRRIKGVGAQTARDILAALEA